MDTTSDYELHFSDKNEKTKIRMVSLRKERIGDLFRPIDPTITTIRCLNSLVGQKVNLCAMVGKVQPSESITSKKGQKLLRTQLVIYDQYGIVILVL